jgi:hypothetical protein
MKTFSVLVAMLFASSTFAADKLVVAKADDKAVLSAPVAKPAPAKRAALAKSTYVPYDYQLERESCCGPQ